MASNLSILPVGSKVSLNLDGSAWSFVVVHQGNPDPELYDASCTGTWLMMDLLYDKQMWGKNINYADASIHRWLNSTLFSKLDSGIQSMVRSVKLPYANGATVYSGADGLDCRMFLLSAGELGWTADYKGPMPVDGTPLDYFKDCADIDSRRVTQLNGSRYWYWTRTPCPNEMNEVWVVVSVNGDCVSWPPQTAYGIRPVMVLSPNTLVDENGAVLPNSAPVLTSPSGANGANLGIRTGPFTLEYTAADPEGSSVHLTEQLDTQTTRTLDADSGAVHQFQAVQDSQVFLQLSNAAHTVQVTASDGLLSSRLSLTFTKAVTQASLTMVQPLSASAPIQVAAMVVEGEIPDDADYAVQVTNNALDPTPVWQDVTDEVRRGYNILFENQTSAKSPAFNFRIRAARGPSGTGGHIDWVAGAFQ